MIGGHVPVRCWLGATAAALVLAIAAAPAGARVFTHSPIPGAAPDAITFGADRDGDGDPDEVHIRLEVAEIMEEVYPGEFMAFWVFAPLGTGMVSLGRLPSPTIRVEEGDRVRITLQNTHYFPHTIHLHGTIHPNASDGVPMITQAPTRPGEAFTYEFVAKNPGTHWYHCHVQPDVHVGMGLHGMLIVEPDRPDNNFTYLVPGAGRMPDMGAATAELYDGEYSLVFLQVDDRLNALALADGDLRVTERRMHREFDTTRAEPNVFLLNGRAFPLALRDTPIAVKSGETVRLRLLNAGEETVQLHTHGHHFTISHLDGYPVPDGARVTRDVVSIGPAQRVDLALYTGDDGLHASGPGVWLMHDHTARAVTNKGLNPGGATTAIVYDGFMGADGLPRTAMPLARYFDPAYYRGEVPVFDPAIFNSTLEDYPEAMPPAGASGEDAQVDGVPDRGAGMGHGHDDHAHGAVAEGTNPMMMHMLEGHRVVAKSCGTATGFRRVEIRGGSGLGGPGSVYGFTPNEIRARPCEEVEVVFRNDDQVRHTFMIPGLSPMTSIELVGPGVQVGRFVTPAEEMVLDFHCHVPAHERAGMLGRLVVSNDVDGGSVAAVPPAPVEAPTEQAEEGPPHFHGVGTVIAVVARQNMVIIDHGEIPGYMAAMTMGFSVADPGLLDSLEEGDRVEFVIDEATGAISDIAK